MMSLTEGTKWFCKRNQTVHKLFSSDGFIYQIQCDNFFLGVSEIEYKILELLNKQGLSIEDISKYLGKPVSQSRIIIQSLAKKGLVTTVQSSSRSDISKVTNKSFGKKIEYNTHPFSYIVLASAMIGMVFFSLLLILFWARNINLYYNKLTRLKLAITAGFCLLWLLLTLLVHECMHLTIYNFFVRVRSFRHVEGHISIFPKPYSLLPAIKMLDRGEQIMIYAAGPLSLYCMNDILIILGFFLNSTPQWFISICVVTSIYVSMWNTIPCKGSDALRIIEIYTDTKNIPSILTQKRLRILLRARGSKRMQKIIWLYPLIYCLNICYYTLLMMLIVFGTKWFII